MLKFVSKAEREEKKKTFLKSSKSLTAITWRNEIQLMKRNRKIYYKKKRKMKTVSTTDAMQQIKDALKMETAEREEKEKHIC